MRETSGKSENEFIKQVTKQQRIDKQIEQKNQQNTKSNANKTALGNQKIQAGKKRKPHKDCGSERRKATKSPHRGWKLKEQSED